MAAEIAEIPAVARRLVGERDQFSAAARILVGRRFTFAVVCARGSSGHAGVLLRYLLETRLGLPVSFAAPAVSGPYRRTLRQDGALFVVVSQSGRSPDLLATTRAASAAGAVVVALVNDAGSPVARAAQVVLPIQAGQEVAIAATKTVAASMVAAACLVAALADDRELESALHRLPERLERAQSLDWSEWGQSLSGARAAYVAGRGYGLAAAREIALKLAETMRLPALGYSVAELRHGPRAAVARDTPVLILRQADETAPGVDALAHELRAAGTRPFVCGAPDGNLPWLGDDHAALDPIAMLVPAYAAIEAAARRAGFDPDRPPHLSKITQTL